MMRGPIVYCLEAADHPEEDLSRLTLPREAELRAEHRAELLGGITILRGTAVADGQRAISFTAVPSYAWGNRAKGAMTVWVSEAAAK